MVNEEYPIKRNVVTGKVYYRILKRIENKPKINMIAKRGYEMEQERMKDEEIINPVYHVKSFKTIMGMIDISMESKTDTIDTKVQ